MVSGKASCSRAATAGGAPDRWRAFETRVGDDGRLYLYGIARNVVHNHQRSARRHLRLAGKSQAHRPLAPPGPEAQVVVHDHPVVGGEVL